MNALGKWRGTDAPAAVKKEPQRVE